MKYSTEQQVSPWVDTSGPGHAFALQLSTQRPNDAVDASLQRLVVLASRLPIRETTLGCSGTRISVGYIYIYVYIYMYIYIYVYIYM